MKKYLFDLQMFNDDGAEEGEEGTTEEEGKEKPEGTQASEQAEEEKFTQEELNDILTKRLAREREKFKKELAAEKKEAERLAKLSKDEREEEELRLEREKFEKEKLDFQRDKLELQVTKELASKNLPVTFANFLVSEDADKSFENIKEFEDNWTKALEVAVKEKLKGTTPDSGGSSQGGEEAGLGKRLAEQRQTTNKQQDENLYF